MSNQSGSGAGAPNYVLPLGKCMKLSIITGGSRGLGKALVRILTQDGWEVKELSRSGTGMAHIPLNLQHPDKVGFTVNELFSTLSSLPLKEVLLINNAGTLTPIKKLVSATEAINTIEICQHSNIFGATKIVELGFIEFRPRRLIQAYPFSKRNE